MTVVYPERFHPQVEPMDADEAEELERQVAEWQALIAGQPHIKRLLDEMGELPMAEIDFIRRYIDQLADDLGV